MLAGAAVGLGLALVFHQKGLVTALATAGGAGLGGLLGATLDQRRCDLYQVAQKNNLKLISAPITYDKLGNSAQKGRAGLDVQVMDKPDEFVPGTATLSPSGRSYFSQIAQQYIPRRTGSDGKPQSAELNQALASRKVLIIAHAAEGDDSSNAVKLSEERARAVAEVFAQAGGPASNIYYQGAGSSMPIASNTTDLGRAENRRVQIVDLPDTADLGQFLSLRAPNPSYFNVAVPGHKPEAPAISVAQASEMPPPASSAPSVTEANSAYDFGGKPSDPEGVPIDIGTPVSRSMFNLVNTASATSAQWIKSCLDDQPHEASEVKNLATGADIAPRNYVPGFDQTVWSSNVNHNFVAITGAAIPIDLGAPVPAPDLLMYRNFNGAKEQKASFDRHVPVNVYRGGDKTVYRMFVGGPAECIDLIVPVNKFSGQANIYYRHANRQYVANSDFAKTLAQ